MANKTPVKAIYSGSDITALGEFESGDTLASSYLDLSNSIGASELNVVDNGTSGQFLTSDGDGTFSWIDPTGGFYSAFAIVQDEKDYNIGGGNFSSGAWRTRDLNTEHSDTDNIVSLASNQFTLQAGTYTIKWSAPGYRLYSHVTRLYNATDASVVAIGQSCRSNWNYQGQNHSRGVTVITIASAKAFEIQHRGGAEGEFGVTHSLDSGTNNVYTVVEILKHA